MLSLLIRLMGRPTQSIACWELRSGLGPRSMYGMRKVALMLLLSAAYSAGVLTSHSPEAVVFGFRVLPLLRSC